MGHSEPPGRPADPAGIVRPGAGFSGSKGGAADRGSVSLTPSLPRQQSEAGPLGFRFCIPRCQGCPDVAGAEVEGDYPTRGNFFVVVVVVRACGENVAGQLVVAILRPDSG